MDGDLGMQVSLSRERLIEAAADQGVERGCRLTRSGCRSSSGRPTRWSDSAAGCGASRTAVGGSTRLSRAVRVLLYAGALLVIGSFGWWSAELDWAVGALLALSSVYAAAFLFAALYARRRGLDELVAASVVIVAFYAAVVAYAALFSLAGFGFGYEKDGLAAFYLWIDGGWIWLELAAIAAAAALYAVFRAPLLILPLGFVLLFFAMDATARLVGVDFDDTSDEAIGAAVLAFGLLSGAAGVALDFRGLRRHALWPHVFCAIGVVDGLLFMLGGGRWELAVIVAGGAFSPPASGSAASAI